MRLILLLSFLLVGCKNGAGDATFISEPGESKVVVFGDMSAAAPGGYAQIIADSLGLPLENYAVPQLTGHTPDLCLGQLQQDHGIERVDSNSIVIIVLGFNDARFYGVPGGNYAQCLDIVKTRMVDRGARVYLAASYESHPNAPTHFNMLNASPQAFVTLRNAVNAYVASWPSNFSLVPMTMPITDGYFDSNFEWLSGSGHLAVANDFLTYIER